jgi:hypothetical protein
MGEEGIESKQGIDQFKISIIIQVKRNKIVTEY